MGKKDRDETEEERARAQAQSRGSRPDGGWGFREQPIRDIRVQVARRVADDSSGASFRSQAFTDSMSFVLSSQHFVIFV